MNKSFFATKTNLNQNIMKQIITLLTIYGAKVRLSRQTHH